MSDPFNWPFPQRKDLMSLSKISQKDVGFLPRRTFGSTGFNLVTNDIKGARPNRRPYQFTNKVQYCNRNNDIEGSSPRKLHQPLNKKYYQMRTNDIIGARPQCNKFVTKRTPSDPLNPVYKLPSAVVRTATPPRFIRDNIQIDDIEGTKSNPQNKYNITRVTNNISDIEGARPQKVKLRKDFIGMQLNVKDINEFMKFETKRVVNPLCPVYKGSNDKGDKITFGPIKGNKPKRLHPLKVNKRTSMLLDTTDIKGAQTFTLSDAFYRRKFRKDFRSNTNTKDIPGAQAGSLKYGMTTKRCTDPCNPQYQFLDRGEQKPAFRQTQNFRKENNKSLLRGKPAQQKLPVVNSNNQRTAKTALGGKRSNAQKLDAFLKN